MDLKSFAQKNKQEFDNSKISLNADVSFKKRLNEEFHSTKVKRLNSSKYLSIAASVILIITTTIWIQSHRKDKQNKAILLSKLADKSTGKKLNAIYEFNDEYKKEDKEIINVLIKTLLIDKNANVKIATIEALLQFPNNEIIRKSLISALSNEKTPLVQIKLINAMNLLREKRAKTPLEDLINNKRTYEIVKNKATLAMSNLNF